MFTIFVLKTVGRKLQDFSVSILTFFMKEDCYYLSKILSHMEVKLRRITDCEDGKESEKQWERVFGGRNDGDDENRHGVHQKRCGYKRRVLRLAYRSENLRCFSK